MGDDWHEFFEDFPEDKPGWGWEWVADRDLESRARACVTALLDAGGLQPAGAAPVSSRVVGAVNRRLSRAPGDQPPSFEVLATRRGGCKLDTVDLCVSASTSCSVVVRVGIVPATGEAGMLEIVD